MRHAVWFLCFLTAFAQAQAPTPDATALAYPLTPAAHTALVAHYFRSYDLQLAGWLDAAGGKRLAAGSLRYALSQAAQDARFTFIAQQTLTAALALQDPQTGAWAESTQHADWHQPMGGHDLAGAAAAIRVYATAVTLWQRAADRAALEKTRAYLLSLRTANGAFSAQPPAAPVPGSTPTTPADAAAPAPGNAPVVAQPDTTARARDAGWAASALLALYALDGDANTLAQAERAVTWANAERRLATGGFGDTDATGPLTLSDTQAVAQAMFDLYLATGTRHWLDDAEQALNQIGEHLRDLRGGFVVTLDDESRPWNANRDVAQLAAQLYQANHNMRYQALAEHALRFLFAEFDPARCPADRLGALLLADTELSQAPPRITVIGYRDDPAAQNLYRAALRLPLVRRQLEWWDRREPTPNPAREFPVLDYAAAYLCNPGCSIPLTTPEALANPPPAAPQVKPTP